MAKLTKKEAAALGTTAARTNETFARLTMFDIDKMDYSEQRAIIKAQYVQPAEVGSDRAADYEAAWAEAANAIFSNKARELRVARNNWKRMIGGMTLKQAVAKVAAIVNESGMRGVLPMGSDGYEMTTCRIRRAGGEAEATIYFRFDHDYEGTRNPDADGQKAGEYNLRAEISWSSSTRDLATAQACAALYADACTLTAEVLAGMRSSRVVWTYGIPEAVEPAGMDDGTQNPEGGVAPVSAEAVR